MIYPSSSIGAHPEPRQSKDFGKSAKDDDVPAAARQVRQGALRELIGKL